MLSPVFGHIPPELAALPRWVTHRNKVPYDPSAMSRKASVTDPETWGTFSTACTAFEDGDRDGIGFVLAADGIVGVDLDKCVTDGTPDPRAIAFLDRIGARYVELSPSGTGLHAWGYGPNIGGRRGRLDGLNVELYSRGRYLTCTGRAILDGPLVELTGFAETAAEVGSISPTEEVRKRTEDVISHLQCSSVGVPPHTLPAAEGERNRRLFDLARWIKGKHSEASRDELRALVAEWHRLALPVIGTKDFATTWTDFMRAMEKVRHPHGATLQTVLATVDHSTPMPDEILALGYGEATHRLIRICDALQSHAGDEPFFLSARQAGELIGMHFTDASKVLFALVDDGVLTLISKGAGRVASRYRFKNQ